MRPPAVCSRVRSTPCCSASRRASGDAFTGEAPVDGEATGAALGDGAVASLAATMTAIVLPTGTTSPTDAVTSRSTPEAGASISTVTLSVSISSNGSPFTTLSPGDLIQRRILPVSCASSRAGMMTFVGILASARQPGEDLARDGQRTRDARPVDVEVRDRPNRVRPERAHANAVREQVLDGFRGVRAGLEENDVRLDGGRVDAHARQIGEPLRQAARVGVIVGEPLHVMAQGIDAARGDDTGLAHGAAHLLLE